MCPTHWQSVSSFLKQLAQPKKVILLLLSILFLILWAQDNGYVPKDLSSASDTMGSYQVNVTEFLLALSECLRTVSNKTAWN